MNKRAWIELDLDNLEHNINEIKKYLKKDTKIMAVVKANAYGHGALFIADKLSQIGVSDFAVATLSEAIELRKGNIKGNILILGYTPLENINDIIKYDLIQTIVDFEYARELSKLVYAIKCHIKIETGMNRIGEKDKDLIKQMYEITNIQILGIYTHLSCCDSNASSDIEYTKSQINKFYEIINYLKDNNINPGKIHFQSSYGFLNYNNYSCDYIRPGLIMYGIYNNGSFNTIKLDLKPVLSLHSKIIIVKNINKAEYVGYARSYKTKKNMKIAVVSIGYADGIFRSLSNNNITVKVNGKFAHIIGKICMDQTIIDVSDIDVKAGDTVHLIDKDITAKYLASKTNTITYEVISKLGSRIERIKKETI